MDWLAVVLPYLCDATLWCGLLVKPVYSLQLTLLGYNKVCPASPRCLLDFYLTFLCEMAGPYTKLLCWLETVSSPEMQSVTWKFVAHTSVYRNSVSRCWELLSLLLTSLRIVASLVSYLCNESNFLLLIFYSLWDMLPHISSSAYTVLVCNIWCYKAWQSASVPNTRQIISTAETHQDFPPSSGIRYC